MTLDPVCNVCCNPWQYLKPESFHEAVLDILCAFYNRQNAIVPEVVIDGVAYPLLTKQINVSSSGDNQIVAGVVSNLISVFGWIMSAAAPVDVIWRSGTTPKVGPLHLGTTGGNVVDPTNPPTAWLTTAGGADLNLNLSGAVNVGGSLFYVQYPTP